jgi:hypothetical protein
MFMFSPYVDAHIANGRLAFNLANVASVIAVRFVTGVDG